MAYTIEAFGDEFTNVVGIKATDDNDNVVAFIKPVGTKSISANGTGIDVAEYASVDVNVSAPSPSLQTKTKTYTPTETAQTESVSADSGYDGLDTVSISVGAISNTYVGTGITRRSSTDLIIGGREVTAPSGYYANSVTGAIPYGTEGSPTATKGTVSNHSVSVTPRVINTEGYIEGGTLEGTAVTVTASELVSGTYTVDSSGTKDVTNYASASVPAGTAGTPTASKGTVSNHSVSVTPSVTNTTGYITGSTKTGTAVTVSASELVSGSETKTANGTYDVTNLASLVVNVPSGTSKNVQVLQSTSRTNSSSLTKVLGDLTVSKTGTYDVYWSGGRSNTSTSYTWGTRLYVNGSGYGTENTTWTNNCQSNHLSNVSLTANQKLSVYARGRTGSYYTFAPMLVIIEA